MFCPKCGTPFEEGSKLCTKCGYEILEETITENENIESQQLQPITASISSKKYKISVFSIIFFILAATVLIMSMYAAHCVISGGLDIGSIESVGGTTLEEAYYQYLGTVFAGYAAIIRATGIFFASVLTYFGIKLRTINETM